MSPISGGVLTPSAGYSRFIDAVYDDVDDNDDDVRNVSRANPIVLVYFFCVIKGCKRSNICLDESNWSLALGVSERIN